MGEWWQEWKISTPHDFKVVNLPSHEGEENDDRAIAEHFNPAFMQAKLWAV